MANASEWGNPNLDFYDMIYEQGDYIAQNPTYYGINAERIDKMHKKQNQNIKKDKQKLVTLRQQQEEGMMNYVVDVEEKDAKIAVINKEFGKLQGKYKNNNMNRIGVDKVIMDFNIATVNVDMLRTTDAIDAIISNLQKKRHRRIANTGNAQQ